MRALIALYHQADDWITEENLMERIDKAFIPDRESTSAAVDSTGISGPRMVSYDEIDRAKKEVLAAPKMSQWDSTAGASLKEKTHGTNVDSWTNNRATRERKVIEALYGVVISTDGTSLLPGLEVVKESTNTLKEFAKDDEENDIFEEYSGEEPRL
jgi:hypothetical protein